MKSEFVDLKFIKFKNNLLFAERAVFKVLKRDSGINIKKVDKGIIIVVMNIEDKK